MKNTGIWLLLSALVLSFFASEEAQATRRRNARVAKRFAATRPWHGEYAHINHGAPLALVVPPTASAHREMGWGVSRDDSQAASYYRQAIRVGSIKAKFNLGMFRMNNANNLIRQSGYDLIVEAANTGFGPAQSFVESAEAASREKARQDWKRYREETSSYGQQCRNPRKVLVSRNGGLYREETVCD